jgi:hypothetical protein
MQSKATDIKFDILQTCGCGCFWKQRAEALFPVKPLPTDALNLAENITNKRPAVPCDKAPMAHLNMHRSSIGILHPNCIFEGNDPFHFIPLEVLIPGRKNAR